MIHETGYWDSKFAQSHHIHSPKVSEWICNFLSPYKKNFIYDFGCGMGDYLKDLRNNGFENLIGFEADPPKKDYDFEIVSQNLAVPFVREQKGIIISLEVGEHLPPKYQDIFLDNISNNCEKFLIVSWAVRGQGGFGHYNELDNHEIIPSIEKRGFTYLNESSSDFRKVPEDYCSYFKNTLMIFEKT